MTFLSTPSARRATSLLTTGADLLGISIHALREEGDLSFLASACRCWSFLSTPSARRATRWPLPCQGRPGISIHALREEGDRAICVRNACGRTFLSTPSARRATCKRWQKGATDVYFYPRPPRGGRPASGLSLRRMTWYFYPRPPRGGRLDKMELDSKGNVFLSTPSARRATGTASWSTTRHRIFLSTPSARRATLGLVGLVGATCISIHALREEGDTSCTI